jgi:hypothetical protein
MSTPPALPPLAALPPTFTTTRDGLHRLACFVISPARKARTGHIGLRATADGFATPPFDDGSSISVRGDRLVTGAGARPISTLRDAASLMDVELSPDPGVGADLPSFEPDADLAVDAAASLVLGQWYAFGDAALSRLRLAVPPAGHVTEAQLWPEHFDLAVVVTLPGELGVNVGFSPGDEHAGDPYAYLGPHVRPAATGGYWNASFGAVLPYGELAAVADPHAAVDAFFSEGLRLVATGR